MDITISASLELLFLMETVLYSNAKNTGVIARYAVGKESDRRQPVIIVGKVVGIRGNAVVVRPFDLSDDTFVSEVSSSKSLSAS